MKSLEETYKVDISPTLQKQLGKKNVMQVPRLSKIVLNVTTGDAVKNPKLFS